MVPIRGAVVPDAGVFFDSGGGLLFTKYSLNMAMMAAARSLCQSYEGGVFSSLFVSFCVVLAVDEGALLGRLSS